MQIQQFLPLLIIVFFLLLSTLFFRSSPTYYQQDQGRDIYIDGIRGLAAIAVIATHFWRLSESGIKYSFEFYNRDAYGSIGVQVFFCVTGLLFFGQLYKNSGNFNWSKFYASRFRRIMPAYLAFFLLSVIVIFLVGNWGAFKTSQIYSIGNMGYMGLKGNGRGVFALGMELDRVFAAIWTLAFELRFYLAFPFVVWISTTKTGSKLLLPMGAALVLYEIASTGTSIAGYFLTGAVAARYLQPIRPSMPLRVACYAVIAVTLYLSLALKLDSFGWERFLLSSALFSALVIAKPKLLAMRPFTVLGDMSYSIYLMHAPLLILMSYLLKPILGAQTPTTFDYLTIILGAVSVMIIFCHFSYKHIESPFLRKAPTTAKALTEPALSR